MGRSFARVAFTPLVKKQQALRGSRQQYERAEQFGKAGDVLTEAEREFILSRDSLYMATVSETGWPYIQHRGGQPGFLHVLDDRRIAFADYRGNRQYISLGNIEHDDRVALFLMDYPTCSRLKILGHAEVREGADAQTLIGELSGPGVRPLAERAIVVRIEAFDWNCQQYITPRYTEEQVVQVMAPVRQRLAELEEENKRLRAELDRVALKG
ncbi:pyridoxamine 5'-phosphate oxidase family protein [Edaphobacter aggregans]|uniref:pyridoxamine 5'-phosphate oxidase family protein n=1 Tax=Edaphobacter aggregans TaxID=570835 RepID=UPI00054FA677|nr:pyridoxamine 5'-phosphate oxidase family protein [Edaphobacter aggregans]